MTASIISEFLFLQARRVPLCIVKTPLGAFIMHRVSLQIHSAAAGANHHELWPSFMEGIARKNLQHDSRVGFLQIVLIFWSLEWNVNEITRTNDIWTIRVYEKNRSPRWPFLLKVVLPATTEPVSHGSDSFGEPFVPVTGNAAGMRQIETALEIAATEREFDSSWVRYCSRSTKVWTVWSPQIAHSVDKNEEQKKSEGSGLDCKGDVDHEQITWWYIVFSVFLCSPKAASLPKADTEYLDVCDGRCFHLREP
jgi:hypothetical protein